MARRDKGTVRQRDTAPLFALCSLRDGTVVTGFWLGDSLKGFAVKFP